MIEKLRVGSRVMATVHYGERSAEAPAVIVWDRGQLYAVDFDEPLCLSNYNAPFWHKHATVHHNDVRPLNVLELLAEAMK